eukprot:superscaffoldBa00001624_g11344
MEERTRDKEPQGGTSGRVARSKDESDSGPLTNSGPGAGNMCPIHGTTCSSLTTDQLTKPGPPTKPDTSDHPKHYNPPAKFSITYFPHPQHDNPTAKFPITNLPHPSHDNPTTNFPTSTFPDPNHDNLRTKFSTTNFIDPNHSDLTAEFPTINFTDLDHGSWTSPLNVCFQKFISTTSSKETGEKEFRIVEQETPMIVHSWLVVLCQRTQIHQGGHRSATKDHDFYQTWQELAGQGEQLTRRPNTEAAGSPDSLRASGDKESKVCGAGTPHPSLPPGPNRQLQGPENVERHTGEAQLHIRLDQDVPTRPSASQDSRYAFPGVCAVFAGGVALECGGGPKSQWVNKYSPMMLAIQNSWTVAEFPAFTLRSTASPPVTVLILQAVGVPSDPSG